jgi:hypothetical protein
MAMAPFWAEIMDFIMPVLLDDNTKDVVKFALYSGHDSTLAPLMASLSPKLWNETNFPWYASMMIIEVSHDMCIFCVLTEHGICQVSMTHASQHFFNSISFRYMRVDPKKIRLHDQSTIFA